MRGRRKAGAILCSILCLAMLLLGGCGQTEVPDTLSVPAISVTNKGKVTAYLIEDFDKDYYDLAELQALVTEELAEFNSSHKTAEGQDTVKMISLTEATDGSQTVKLVLEFRNIASYTEYTGMELFYGTVTQAYEAGCDLDKELTSVKDGSTIDKMGIYEHGNKNILIAREKVRIYGPGKALYISTGAALNDDGSVDPSDTEDSTYIIMK
ncbi:MAG: hypothetical protein J6C54_04545 [Lachnospiraceae bacterium]|nr:hypothetical protein [Lachnospiraceae bacterium]